MGELSETAVCFKVPNAGILPSCYLRVCLVILDLHKEGLGCTSVTLMGLPEKWVPCEKGKQHFYLPPLNTKLQKLKLGTCHLHSRLPPLTCFTIANVWPHLGLYYVSVNCN